MANPRKVQAEIDKLMKKVKEGMEVYEGVFEKVQSAPDKLQKEKFEAELKKEIKKLQRHREQIKALVANPEVKDKKILETTRRDIEVKMEAFKVCERETKTKAFSKEGLLAAKNDPATRAKMKTVGWINEAIDKLQDQIDQLEYDIENDTESAQPAKKGKKGAGDVREERMARNNYHILKLESILRVLENGDIEADEIDTIEGDVMAYVDGISDPNYEEDEQNDLYEMFDLPEGMVQNITGGAGGDSDTESDSGSPKKPAAEPVVATPPQKVAPKPAAKKVDVPAPAAKAVPAAAKQPVPTPSVASPSQPVAAKAATPAANVQPQKTPVTPLSSKTASSPVTAGKSMAAVVAGHRAAEEAKAAPPTTLGTKELPKLPPKDAPSLPKSSDDVLMDEDADENNDDTFGDDAMDGVTPGAGSLADMASLTSTKLGGDWLKPLPATVVGQQPAAAPQKTQPVATAPVATQPQSSQPQPQPQSLPQQQVQPPVRVAQPVATAAPAAQTTPPAKSVPLPSFATTQAASTFAPGVPNPEIITRMLQTSIRNLPHTSDCERPKGYTPPNPYLTPEYYPQTVHPAFSVPDTFSKFDADTLFFIFYYQQTTYQQYLAAKELKRGSWRFHKKFQTWFQRHDRPKVTTEEYEQGVYVYFDFENGWCQRIKGDFVFKYQHLEDSLT